MSSYYEMERGVSKLVERVGKVPMFFGWEAGVVIDVVFQKRRSSGRVINDAPLRRSPLSIFYPLSATVLFLCWAYYRL